MNKYQDALRRCESDFEDRVDEDNILMVGRMDIELLEELVDLHTPKKPISVLLNEGPREFGYVCGKCAFTVFNHYRYCDWCGQKIDWEK